MRVGGTMKRDFRNLANITETASTSRILNLTLVHAHSAKDPDYAAHPFFHNPKLNKAILIKHTLRPHELELFARPRRTATKVILPFDALDLRLGGESLFINQVGFEQFARNFLNLDNAKDQRDLETLRMLDTLPSLDPFILRESMARKGMAPAACYLKISANDIASMTAFANAEIERLTNIAFADGQSVAAMRFTGKILSHDLDAELDPLKKTLKLSHDQFAEGIFSWRGFLYFKWRYLELQDELRRVIEGLGKYQPIGFIDAGLKACFSTVRPRLAQRILTALSNVGGRLAFYDQAYSALIERHDPAPFRRFLIEGPKMFYELGDHVGILTHIASFWAYRMASTPGGRLSPVEYADTLLDFDESLAGVIVEEETPTEKLQNGR